MGASQSAQVPSEEEEDDDGDDEDEEEEHDVVNDRRELVGDSLTKKVLKQEPEMLPCHESASPLTPQLSNLGTPHLSPSIEVWDRSFSGNSLDDHRVMMSEVYLVCHGECRMNLRPDLVGGRCPEAALTPNGKRQARALAAFFKSRGIQFNLVYTSPLDRARATAISVCQEMNFCENQIQSSDALLEMSQGDWEGYHKSEIFTPETISSMERFQPDFCAPSGESLRQVEFRMVQFLNGIVISLPEKLRSEYSPADQSESQSLSRRTSPHHDRNRAPPLQQQQQLLHLDSPHRHHKGMSRKKSGKSRLQIVTNTTAGGDNEADDEMSPRQPVLNNHGSLLDINVKNNPFSPTSSSSSSSCSCIGVFTHSVPIKCLITGLLGCSPVMSNKICIEDSSVTMLQHSWKTGWQIKKLNDTAHLRLI